MTALAQTGEFSLCVAFGLLFAFAVDLFGLKKGRFSAWIDGVLCVIFAALFVWIGVLVPFLGRRGYHYLGIFLGIILYSKTFQIIVAFFKKVCYNTVKKLVKSPRKKLCKRQEKEI